MLSAVVAVTLDGSETADEGGLDDEQQKGITLPTRVEEHVGLDILLKCSCIRLLALSGTTGEEGQTGT